MVLLLSQVSILSLEAKFPQMVHDEVLLLQQKNT